MKKPPHYELKRINSDRGENEVEIVSVVHPPWQARMTRREMLGASFGSAALLTILMGGGCSKNEQTVTTLEEKNCGEALAHRDAIKALAISPDGKRLASGSNDSTIKLWQLPSGALTNTLTKHTKAVQALAFSPDGKILASADANQTIRLWNMSDGVVA
jgi:WD40 repeat protein